MTGEILFLAHRIPFPPDRGDKIRSHHVLKRLAKVAPVHVATLADDETDMENELELALLAQSYRLVQRSKPLALAGVQALARHRPVSLSAFHARAIDAYVRQVIATRPIVAIYVFSGQMGQYVPQSFAGRVIADFVDVDSAKFEAYAAAGSGFRRWIDAREGRLLRQEEVRLAARANVSLLISEAEAALFRERLPAATRAHTAVRVLGNGIDSDLFDPALVTLAEPMLRCPGPRLIFTGQMDYAPNIAAAERVFDAILPRIREQFPQASFHVVGRNPPESLTARHGEDGCYVWGKVADMRAWLKAADLALVPLAIGRGVQNKVLEAMAMALPVVLTPEASTGIGARDGSDFRVAVDNAALAEAACSLLGDPRKAKAMGDAARDFVVENVSWEAALMDLPEIVGIAGSRVRHAA